MAPLIVLVIIFLSVFVLSPSSSSSVAASPELTAKVCNGNPSFSTQDFCLKTLANPKAAAAKNIKELTVAIMNIAAEEGQTTLNLIIEMEKKAASPGSLAALKTCEEVYRYGVRSFGMIPKELDEDPQSANYDICVIGPEFNGCDQALAEAKVNAPQITQANKDLLTYSAMGGEISTELYK
ncbi:hypothetical protein PTKIN_Ptkin01aG0004200 [Pterospermum kingtungense]